MEYGRPDFGIARTRGGQTLLLSAFKASLCSLSSRKFEVFLFSTNYWVGTPFKGSRRWTSGRHWKGQETFIVLFHCWRLGWRNDSTLVSSSSSWQGLTIYFKYSAWSWRSDIWKYWPWRWRPLRLLRFRWHVYCARPFCCRRRWHLPSRRDNWSTNSWWE